MTAPRHDLVAALPGLIAVKISAVLPGLATCEGIAGRFDVDRLKRTGTKAPAVLVSMLILRPAQTYAGPVYTYDADFAAFVITKTTQGLSRDEAAGNIVQALLRLLPDNNWGQGGVGPCRDVTATPLNSEAIQKEGMALWAVSWSQLMQMEGYAVPLPLPIDLYLGQAPDIGPGNEDKYTQITGVTP
jgi:hypothetical protein